MGLDFRILGPLEVNQSGRPLALGGRKQRSLLAMLLLHANEAVHPDLLVEEIWHGVEPEGAARSLHVYVSSLRKALGNSATALETRPEGYALALDRDRLDAYRFERLLGEGRARLAGAEPEQALALLEEALALWRGPALADLAYEPFAQSEIARLEELRVSAIEERIDAELTLGRHTGLVAELEALVAHHPLRERSRGQLMLALYRSGRQADALERFNDGREALVEELGLEPSPGLRELQSAILQQDPSLSVEPHELQARRRLPAPATALVGRRAEVEEVCALFGEGGARLVTVTGAGGSGKTRIAIQAAWELAEHFPDGVHFVALASVRDPELVPAAIRSALGVSEVRERPLVETLKEHLRERRLLLLLDNFEQVDEAAPLLATLLAEAPGLQLLVTSRRVLRLYGAHELPVQPLALPEPNLEPVASRVEEYEAIALFAARARAVRRDFRITSGNAAVVVDICRRLDGLPLAIELAAARSRELRPERMLEVLPQRLELAAKGPPDLPARQQTLRATIDWSYRVLGPDERTLFARLGVFESGCSLDAAQVICAAELTELAALVDANLLVESETTEGETRLAMLETLREYAVERLEECGDAEAVRRKHAHYFLALAEEAEPDMFGPKQSSWLERLETDHNNMNAARVFLTRSGEAELALKLLAAVWRFLYLAGRLTEGRKWLAEALAETQERTEVRVRALIAASALAVSQGANQQGRKHSEEALALARQLNDTWGIATASNQLGGLCSVEGDTERAAELHEMAVVLSRELGDNRMLSASIANLGVTALYGGEHDRAVELLSESLALARTLQSTGDVARMLGHLGLATLHQSRVPEASSLFSESLTLAHEGKFKVTMLWGLEGLAAVAATRGEAERAGRLCGASDALAKDVGVPFTEIRFVQPMRERSVAAGQSDLGERAFAAAMDEGRRLSLDDAVAHALERASCTN